MELGCGAGYDAFELCNQGADYVGIDIAFENPKRTKTHLGYYDLTPSVLVANAERLPFQNDSFEVLFSNGVLHHTPNIQRSFREAHRVLEYNGEFWVILYHRNSIFYWITLGLVDHILRMGFQKRSFVERLSMIEYTTSEGKPIVNVYSKGELKKLARSAGFQVEKIKVRKLVREDLPCIPLSWLLWRFLPQTLLDLLGQIWGWYLIAKLRKI